MISSPPPRRLCVLLLLIAAPLPLAALLALGGCAGGGGPVIGSPVEAPSPTPLPLATKPPPPIRLGKAFETKEFTIQPPKEFRQRKEVKDGVLWELPLADEKYSPALTVRMKIVEHVSEYPESALDLNDPIDLQYVTELVETSARLTFPEYRSTNHGQVEDQERRIEALFFESAYVREYSPIRLYRRVYVRERTLYYVTGSAPTAVWEEFGPLLEASIATFALRAPPAPPASPAPRKGGRPPSSPSPAPSEKPDAEPP